MSIMQSAEQLIKHFQEVSTLPQVVARLTHLINDTHSTLQDFEQIIRMDPVLVSRLLTLVNSSYYGLVHRVDSISRAIALLGMKNLHNIAVTEAIHGMFHIRGDNHSFSLKRLWKHCAGTAICAKMIAERIFSLNGDDAYLVGILHDIGLIVELQETAEPFLRAFGELSAEKPSITLLEQHYIGTDHCEIGYLLACKWQMAPALAEAIRDHHSDSLDLEPQSPCGILQISEYLLSQLDLGIKEHVPIHIAPRLETHIQDNLDEYRVLASDLPEEIDQLTSLYQDEHA